MQETMVTAEGYRFADVREGRELGHAYLYVLKNDLHGEPFGLLEDLFVEPEYRSQGVGGALHVAVVDKARSLGCYKLIATSRTDGTREAVHEWYARLGYRTYGAEFRMDL